MKAANQQLAEWDKELNQLHERNGDLGLEVQNLKEELKIERADRKTIEEQCSDMIDTIDELRSELADLKQNSATASQDLPDAADLLNQLKAKRKKSSVTLADVEKILEILGGDQDD